MQMGIFSHHWRISMNKRDNLWIVGDVHVGEVGPWWCRSGIYPDSLWRTGHVAFQVSCVSSIRLLGGVIMVQVCNSIQPVGMAVSVIASWSRFSDKKSMNVFTILRHEMRASSQIKASQLFEIYGQQTNSRIRADVIVRKTLWTTSK